MLNNNHKNLDCTFAESLVSYLYDEIGSAEKYAFEAHLENCAPCIEELKEFGFARTAIHEWRTADFDCLPTPIFEIPTQTTKSVRETQKSPTWFDGWKQIISFKPAMAMAALVILIALFSIAAFVFNFKTDEPLAENHKEKELIKVAVSPTVEKRNEDKKEIAIAKNPESLSVTTVNPTVNIEDRKPVTVKPAAAKVSTAMPKNGQIKVIQTDVRRNPKANTTQKSEVPRLTEAEAEEDDSVRLADLFDEIGTD